MLRPAVPALLALLLAVGACATDGDELRPPDPSLVEPAAPSLEAPDGGSDTPTSQVDLLLTSPAFSDAGPLPERFTCAVDDPVSPPLSWIGVPIGAAELAVSVVDPDAGFEVVWVIAGITPDTESLPEAVVADPPLVEARNAADSLGWNPPCPTEEHRYVFNLHVLPEPLGLAPDLPGQQALSIIEASTIRVVTITATVGPPA